MTVTRGAHLFIVMVLLVSFCAPPVSTPVSASPTDVRDAGNIAQTTPQNASNTSNTTRHLGPDFPESDADPTVVLTELEARLGSRLVSSTDAVEARQFDVAAAELQGNTTEMLQQYRQIAADSPESVDDDIARELNLTVQQQRELVTAARNARATYSEYQLAQANGNQTRARRLARELLNESTVGNRTAGELIDRYERLQNSTAINATEPITGLETARSRLDQLQEAVRRESFVETSLTVETTATSASPVNSLQFRGRLSANESGLTNEAVELTVGSRTVRTRTDENGTFNVTLRPMGITPGVHTARVRYLPAMTSKYESTNTETNVSVESVSPNVTSEVENQRVRFGDEVAVAGRVSANTTGLSDVAVQVTLDGQRLGQTRTDGTGEFRISRSLPASIPSGTRTLTVSVSESDSPVRETTQQHHLTVDPTATEIELDARQLNETSIRVSGQLRTEDGAALSDRPVEITVGDADPLLVRSNGSGQFTTTVNAAGQGDGFGVPFTARQLSVRSSYQVDETNLESTNSTVTVSYTPPPSESVQQLFFGAIILVLLGGGGFLWQRRESGNLQSDDGTTGPIETPLEDGTVARTTPSALFAYASAYYERGEYTDAVRLGYAALRRQYVDDYGISPALTHWELSEELADDLGAEEQNTLGQATAAYERAAYTDRSGDDLVLGGDVETLLDSIENAVGDPPTENIYLPDGETTDHPIDAHPDEQ